MHFSEVGQILSVQGDDNRHYLSELRVLFQEYASGLGFGLEFQSFQRELDELPGEYAPPQGRLLLALWEKRPAGCIALRPLEEGICEMKRLYVRPAFRARGIGSALTERLIGEAISIGYEVMRLDSIDTMDAALRLYRTFGFREIAPYRYNPIPGAVYLELDLNGYSAAGGAKHRVDRP